MNATNKKKYNNSRAQKTPKIREPLGFAFYLTFLNDSRTRSDAEIKFSEFWVKNGKNIPFLPSLFRKIVLFQQLLFQVNQRLVSLFLLIVKKEVVYAQKI